MGPIHISGRQEVPACICLVLSLIIFFSSSSSETRELEHLFEQTDSKADETGSRTLPGNRPAAGTCEDGEVSSPNSNNSFIP